MFSAISCNFFTKTNINHIKNENGAVTIEFTIVALSFILIMYLVSDFGITLSKQGRLERTCHSLASIIRERKTFYNSNEDISQKDVEQLLSVGKILLDEPNLNIVVDALYLTPDPQEPTNNSLAQEGKKIKLSSGNNKCKPINNEFDFLTLKRLSPYASSSGRWIPIYRVSACVPNGVSAYEKIIGTISGNILTDLTTSAVTISRI